MTAIAATDKLFFERSDAAPGLDGASRIVEQALAGSDDGELFLEYRESEQISLDDGRIRAAGFDSSLGFGLRAVAGEATGFAHAGEISEPALRRAAASVAAIKDGHSGTVSDPPRATNSRLYSDANPSGPDGLLGADVVAGGDRCLCPSEGRPGRTGHGVDLG